ncbi:MAG: hypothetical protein RRB13_11720 [bacterium]|nr:hypothetical protein [bacterium]
MMVPPRLDRNRLKIKPLSERQSKADASVLRHPGDLAPVIEAAQQQRLAGLAGRIIQARQKGAPVLLTYGAHLFRNGMSPLIIDLMERGFIQQLTTNGAGGIHDWELAFHGRTTEDVQQYLSQGQFGIWEETGRYQNLALLLGAAQGLGYGASLGKMMAEERLELPDPKQLKKQLAQALSQDEDLPPQLAAQAALLQVMSEQNLTAGVIDLPHPGRESSLLYQAYRLGIPLSICPGIGYDIIYSHPYNNGAALGQAALDDFLAFAHSVRQMQGGVYLSVGSAVMSPMILEKALSMARNLALQDQTPLENYQICVVDMQPGTWDWATKGDPPKDNPAYYLRFCKSFSRMGGDFAYYEMDNRAFFHNLYQEIMVADAAQALD